MTVICNSARLGGFVLTSPTIHGEVRPRWDGFSERCREAPCHIRPLPAPWTRPRPIAPTPPTAASLPTISEEKLTLAMVRRSGFSPLGVSECLQSRARGVRLPHLDGPRTVKPPGCRRTRSPRQVLRCRWGTAPVCDGNAASIVPIEWIEISPSAIGTWSDVSEPIPGAGTTARHGTSSVPGRPCLLMSCRGGFDFMQVDWRRPYVALILALAQWWRCLSRAATKNGEPDCRTK